MNNMYDILNKFNSVAGREQLNEGKKPDFLDLDKDGNTSEPMAKAAKEVDEASYSAKAARAGKDIGKPGKAFAQIAKSAGEKYGSKERGEKVAGAVLAKLRHPKEDVEEGILDTVKKVGGAIKKGAGKALDTLGHGSDEDLIRDLQKKAGVPQTGKKPGQADEGVDKQAFAALAPPKDKITFADKIAGAKKEVDEMLGDVAADAMRKAISGRGEEVEEGWDDMVRDVKARGDAMRTGEKRKTSKGELEKTATGMIHRRSYDPKTGETDTGDEAPAAGEKRGRGRPKGTKSAIGAKGPSGKSKLMTKESASEDDLAVLERLMDEAFAEGKNSLGNAIQGILQQLSDGDEELDEKAVSKKQQKFMGMVHATQKGEKAPSKEVAKVAKTMKKKDAEDFASTKHKGLPEKKKPEGKKEEVDETTVAGSVATGGEAAKDPGAPKKEKASKGSMQFGKGVYEGALAESFESKLNSVLNEGMSINMSMDQEGRKNLTVTATDEDAESLADLLKMAGLGGQEHGSCEACGQAECGCEQVEEELANSADNTEYADTDTMVNTLSGGLNGRKTTGQTTVPVVNRDPRRGSIGTVAEQVQEDAEKRLWAIYNRYSTK